MLKQLLTATLISLMPMCLSANDSWQQSTDWQALELEIDTLRQEQGIALASSAADSDGTLWQYTKGAANADNADNDSQIDADSLFRAGSVTKVFTAIAVLQLMEQGKLKLDDPVSLYLPNVHVDNPWAKTDPVRVKDLLSHTAGFRDADVTEIYVEKADASAPLSQVVAKYPFQVRWRPGTRQAYSNFGYLIAGLLIEQLSGEPFESLLARTILQPLKMNSSNFSQQESVLSTLVAGHGSALTGGKDRVPAMPVSVRPAGSLVTSLNDLTRFSRMLLNEGELDGARIISKTSFDLMLTSAMDKNSATHQAAYGLGLYPVSRESGRYFCHSGGIDGFLSNICFSKQQNMAFVALSNAMTLSGGQVFNKALPLLAKAQLPEAQPLDFDIKPWLGFYRPQSSRQQSMEAMDSLFKGSELSYEEGHLLIKPLFGSADKYVYVAEQGFRPADKASITLTLVLDSQGQPVIQESWDTYLPDNSWYAPLLNYAFLTFAITLMLTSVSGLLLAIYLLIRKSLGKSISSSPKLVFALLLLPITLFGLYLCFTQLAMWELSHVTIAALVLWLLSWSWPVAIAYFSWLIWQGRSKLNLKRSKAFWGLALTSQWVMALYLVHFGAYNMMLWS
jgi:CubicO group peptidase (beta-lactamase class C family)